MPIARHLRSCWAKERSRVRPLYSYCYCVLELLGGPCGQSVAMQRLVSPDLQVKVYTISHVKALRKLVAGLRLDSTLASNLWQLLGFQMLGNGGRQGRQIEMAGN